MSRLLEEIKQIDQRAADALKRADLHTDSDIQALTREELVELFPGVKDIKLRRTIFDVIHKRPVEQLLKKLKGFIPTESFRAALTDNGVLVDYLRILKDMKTQTNNVQSFLEAHISLLEEFSKNQPDQESANCGPVNHHTGSHPPESQKSSSGPSASVPGVGVQSHSRPGGAQESSSGPRTSVTRGPVELHSGQSYCRPGGAPDSLLGSGTSDVGVQVGPPIGPQGTQKSSSGPRTSVTRGPVELHSGQSYSRPGGAPGESFTDLSPRDLVEPTLYKMVVSGKTFDTHLKLMEKVEKQVQNQIRRCDDSQDNKVTFVFCPISSRVASDVEAAMTDVKDDKPVILVLMHHTRQARPTSMKTWQDDDRVVLHVNVFYHDTVGLLRCEQNDAAVTEIQNKLLESFIQRSIDTSGNAQGVGADQRGTDQRGTGQRGADQRGTDQRGTGQRGADQRGTGQRGYRLLVYLNQFVKS
ncbi:uncharacterized protein [Cebidichthys violaceus]|uniref:uncharacterized protein isoform X2 n=1 Tax=Cebidichthys violaceus TaxID=271503 RepID=UPI0035C963E7